MTVQFIKVTKKDRVCYAPVPEPLEEGDKLEIMEMKDEALFLSLIHISEPTRRS